MATETEQQEPIPAAEQTETAVVSETTNETGSEQEQQQQGRGKGGFQKRIDRLTKRNHELETRYNNVLAMQEQILGRLDGKPAATTENKATAAPVKPTPDQFASYEEFVEALADFKADQRIEAKLRSHKETEQKATEEQQQEQTFRQYSERVEEAQGRYDDFDEVVGRSDIQIPNAVQMAVIELENGPDVAYYLGTHPEVCKELVAMRPMAAVAKLGRIAATLEAELEQDEPENDEEEATAEAEPVRKPKPIAAKPSAPAPIRPVRKPAPTATGLSDDLPMDEWLKRRRAQLKTK